MATYYVTTECVTERIYTVRARSQEEAEQLLRGSNFTLDNEEISASEETITEITREE